ncbi:MAG: fasciclin domain-containing protein [Chitinophagaceae bacterium]|nr:fasciclin domain-containing protein [Chitinophagaceae bacterium]
MKYITKRIKTGILLSLAAIAILSSCNKGLEQIASPAYVAPTLPALGTTIAAIPNDSLYYKLIVRGGMLTTINSLTTINTQVNMFTMFVPDNQAMRNFINLLSGGATIGYTDAQYVGFINTAISAANAASIVSYNMIPQSITMASVPSTFPNWFYPTHLNPTTGTPGFNPLVRLTTSPSTRNGNWVNNVPLTSVNLADANGYIHTADAVPATPSQSLWDRINTDADMTYLKAAIQRADSGGASQHLPACNGPLRISDRT